MDYRYETKNDARDFHMKRIAFIIIDEKIYYIKNSSMSHWEFCQGKNISKEDFNNLTRGYYLDGDICFYKGNFTYDEQLIGDALKYLVEIKKELNIPILKIYFGRIVPTKADEEWKYDLYYGNVDEKDNIHRNIINNDKDLDER